MAPVLNVDKDEFQNAAPGREFSPQKKKKIKKAFKKCGEVVEHE